MSYAKRNSKKGNRKPSTQKGEKVMKNTTTNNQKENKKGSVNMGIPKDFVDSVVVSFIKVMNTKDLGGAINILSYGDDLAPYVSGIIKSADRKEVEDYIISTDYTLSDGEYISCMSVLNKAIKAVRVQKNARDDTKCTKLFDTINSLMQKADDDTIEMSGVIGQVIGMVMDNILDISSDDATRIALAIVLNAVACKTIDLCEKYNISPTTMAENTTPEDNTAEETKTEASKTKEKTEDKKEDDSIEGIIDSVNTIFVQNCMDMWIKQYGESRRDEVAKNARQAVSMVVRDTTDLITLKKNPDKFVQENTFKVLSLMTELMSNDNKNTEEKGDEIDNDTVRKFLATVMKDGLKSFKSPLITMAFGLAPSEVIDKVLALAVESRDVETVKADFISAGITKAKVQEMIDDPTNELRVSIVNKMKGTGMLEILARSKDKIKEEIVGGLNKLVSSVTDTHITLTEEEINNIGDKVEELCVGVSKKKEKTDERPKAETTECHKKKTVDVPVEEIIEESDPLDTSRSEFNSLVAGIFAAAREKANAVK